MSLDRMIGLGQRPGKLVSGEVAVKSALAGGRVKLLVIAADATARTQGELTRMSDLKNVPIILYGSKELMGRLIGKSPRSALAFTDIYMARGILGAMERGDVKYKN